MDFTHLDDRGRAKMVDISAKKPCMRSARAEGRVLVSPETILALGQQNLPKGHPFEVARMAGVQAAKSTSSLIPLCHTLSIDFADVQIAVEGERQFVIRSTVRCRWATGVEMEALTAVSVAALTLYDMCKSVDSDIRITDIRLIEKKKWDSDGGGSALQV